MHSASPAIAAPTPGQAAVIAIARDPAIASTLARAVPKQQFLAHKAALDANPKNGPRYVDRSQESSLRFMYSTGEVFTGILAVLAEVIDASPDAKIVDLAMQTHAEATAAGRLVPGNMTHDLREFGQRIVGGVAEWVSDVRQALSDREEARRWGGKAPEYSAHERYGPPRWQMQHLARGAIWRWLPAIQNIISRLPLGEREAERLRAQVRLGEYVHALAKLSTLTRKASDEYKRWDRGFGAVDFAILASADMVTCARKLADRMEGDDATTRALRLRAVEAVESATAALDKLSIARFAAMYERVWHRNKADMVAFARRTGGIGPDLEVLYHTKGSKFLGY